MRKTPKGHPRTLQTAEFKQLSKFCYCMLWFLIFLLLWYTFSETCAIDNVCRAISYNIWSYLALVYILRYSFCKHHLSSLLFVHTIANNKSFFFFIIQGGHISIPVAAINGASELTDIAFTLNQFLAVSMFDANSSFYKVEKRHAVILMEKQHFDDSFLCSTSSVLILISILLDMNNHQ